MGSSYIPEDVIMIGSFPAKTEEQAMTRINRSLPGRLRSIPDGEVGIRDTYVAWQTDVFPPETLREMWHGFLGLSNVPAAAPGTTYTLKDVKSTGYGDAAIASYEKFKALQASGEISQRVKFQVSLPSPMNVLLSVLRNELYLSFEPFYEERLYQSIQDIVAVIPLDDLVIQFDFAWETIWFDVESSERSLDAMWQMPFLPIKEGILERVQRLCTHVPAGFPLGFHLCYGDLGHRHFIEPLDLAPVVQFANDLVEFIGPRNPVRYIHMPVPKDRTDAAYFAPLKNLHVGSAKLYLGLVHAHDLLGTKLRIQEASAVYIKDFGISTECGLGRTPEDDVQSILEIMRIVTVSNSQSNSAA